METEWVDATAALLYRHKEVERVRRVVEEMDYTGVNVQTLTIATVVAQEQQMWYERLQTRLQTEWPRLDKRVMARVVKELRGTPYVDRLLEWLQGVDTSADVWIPVHCIRRDVQQAKQAYDTTQSPVTVSTMSTLLHALTRQGPTGCQVALDTFLHRIEHNLPIDHTCCASAVYAALFNGDKQRALDIVQHSNQTLTPTSEHYSQLLRLFASFGHANIVRYLLEEMQSLGYPISQYDYSAAIDLYGKQQLARPLRTALEMLHVDKNPIMDEALTNTLLDACQRYGDYTRVLEEWDRVVECNHAPNNVMVSVTLDMCGRYGFIQRAMDIWQHCQDDERVVLNTENYTSWVECLARTGHIQTAWRILTETMPTKNLQPQSKAIHTLASFVKKWNSDKVTMDMIQEKFPHVSISSA
jgi:hypothetical protein